MSYRQYSGLSSTRDYGSRNKEYGSSYSSGAGSSIGSYGKSYGYGSLGSDTSSIRSYGSNIGSYKNSPDTSRWRSPSYSAPRDSSLAFATLNRGYVSSLKDRFSAAPSTGDRRLSFSRSLSGGRDYSTRTSGYASDLDVRGSTRSSYGANLKPSIYPSNRYGGSTPASREVSPLSSNRMSRADYSRPSTDYGSRYSKKYETPESSYTKKYDSSDNYSKKYDSSDSYSRPYVSPSKAYVSPNSKMYGSGSASTAYSPTTSAKPREYSLTPFSSRRTTRSSDVSLTPYTSRLGRSLSTEATTAAATTTKPAPERQTSRESVEDTPRRTRSVDYDVSSDSANEPEGGNKDPSVRFLTSRATSPMDPDRDYRSRPIHREKRRILIARTKTKVYPVKVYKRRRDRPVLTTLTIQIDCDELDKYAGRVRRRKDRQSYGSRSSSNYAPKYAGVGTSYSSKPSSTSSRKDSAADRTPDTPPAKPLSPPLSPPPPQKPTSPTLVEQTRSMWQKRDAERKKKKQEKPTMPKQSSFMNRSRLRSAAADDSVFGADDTDVLAERETDRDFETDDDNMGTLPQQSNFYSARKKQQLNQHLAVKAAKSTIIPLTPENLNLKESIDKVKSWKKQLQQSPPESPGSRQKSAESIASSKSITRQLSRGSSREEALVSPPPAANQRDRRQTSKDRRMFAGVPQFPTETETDVTEDERPLVRPTSAVSSAPRRQLLHKERSPSPYDNLAEREALERRRPLPPMVIIDGEPVSPEPRPDNRRRGRAYLSKGNESVNESVNFADVSSMTSEEEDEEKPALGRSPSIESMETQANGSLPRRDLYEPARSVDSFTTGTASPSEYMGRQPGVFIGGVRDIDSLLDFTETEDDFDFSDDDADESDYRQQDSASRHNQGSTTTGVLSPVREEGFHYGANHRPLSAGSVTPPERLQEIIYICDMTDIDDWLGEDNESYRTTVPEPVQHHSRPPPLTLEIPTSPIDLQGSSESLLDTPVPETPDRPLAPVQAFSSHRDDDHQPPSARQTQSMEQLDTIRSRSTEQLDGAGSPLKTPGQKSKRRGRQASNMTKSAGNLDDLDNLLDNISTSSMKKKAKGRDKDAFELFSRKSKSKLRQETESECEPQSEDVDEVDDAGHRVPTARLVDVTYDSLKRTPTPDADYCAAAVQEALRLQDTEGEAHINELLMICERKRPVLPPWKQDQEDRQFTGYVDLSEMLTHMEVDVRKLEDCALQLYKYNGAQGDYGTYLDLETPLEEQSEEMEGFTEVRKNAIILRTQLSVRVHACIEKLLNSNGRELRRALFSLKQIFQDDKDLVHEFVNHDGLECLIKVGSEADQNYQNYILRALGQVMLYVDGMNGVINHNQTIQWLYSLFASRFRLVVKTALKLLLVFIEYTECNTLLLIKAVNIVDERRVVKKWMNLMNILTEKDGGDTELLLYAMTLINKVLIAIPDQDTFYDVTDNLEEQGMERIIQQHMNRKGADLDLLEQFQLYEMMLRQEDGECEGVSPTGTRKMPRIKSEEETRKSRRYSTGCIGSARRNRRGAPGNLPPTKEHPETREEPRSDTGGMGGRKMSSRFSEPMKINWKRPEYAEEQEEPSWKTNGVNESQTSPAYDQGTPQQTKSPRRRRITREQDEGQGAPHESDYQSTGEAALERRNNSINESQSRSSGGGKKTDILPLAGISNNARWMKYKISKQTQDEQPQSPESPQNNGHVEGECISSRIDNLKQGGAMAPRQGMELTNQGSVSSARDRIQSEPDQEGTNVGESRNALAGALSGMLSRARDGLSESQGRYEREAAAEVAPVEVKKSESDIQWEQLERTFIRSLKIKDMDFSDLKEFDDINLIEAQVANTGVPPPLPGGLLRGGPPPPPPSLFGGSSPTPPAPPAPPLPFGATSAGILGAPPPAPAQNTPQKTRKTVKLHWQEARFEYMTLSGRRADTIWSKLGREIGKVELDTEQLEHLFENRTTELKPKKHEGNKKEITVLDPKRSNAINIGMTVLPPPRTIKAAILKMDNSIINREGIEKLLTTMLPTEEEKGKILEAQMDTPDIPLGTAEQFLLTLSSINELYPRLSLWAFKLDYETTEGEIAEPLMDLMKGIEVLQYNKTFKYILTMLLHMGNFLNGVQCKGFTLEYLMRVPEVKDTVHKHSLLYHLCNLVIDQFPRTTDLYSEIGELVRCSKVDFDELAEKLLKLEHDCKASWDHLRGIAKHDNDISRISKLTEFLSDCAERIIVLKIVHRRVMNRFHKFLLFLGYPSFTAKDVRVNAFCKLVTVFALEYRTTRERVLQQREKKASQRERRKTRGKMIIETEKFTQSPRPKRQSSQGDNALHSLLHNGYSTDQEKTDHLSLPGARVRKRCSVDQGLNTRRSLAPPRPSGGTDSESVYDTADDEVLDAVMKSATNVNLRTPRDRKRCRNRERKSRRLQVDREWVPSATNPEDWSVY